MGVYIKGMEMPTSCSVCWALDDYGDYPRCRITEEQRGYNFPIRQKRMNNCPLVPVPPHGDLIDRDAAKESIKPWSPEDERSACTFDTVKKLMHTLLNRAPTIIPAESAKEGE